MWAFGQFGHFGADKQKKQAKPKKHYETFFHKLTVDEMKTLLKTTKQKVSGSKDELISRLIEHPSTGAYASEGCSIIVFAMIF